MYSKIYKSPVGKLLIVANDDALTRVDWCEHDVLETGSNIIIEKTIQQLDKYFSGESKSFDLPLDPSGTDFQKKAWMALRGIPYAQTISYKQQAEKIGNAKAVRAIGAANGKNPISIIVPCHRVIGSDGKLTGYAGGVDTKLGLLEHEAKFA